MMSIQKIKLNFYKISYFVILSLLTIISCNEIEVIYEEDTLPSGIGIDVIIESSRVRDNNWKLSEGKTFDYIIRKIDSEVEDLFVYVCYDPKKLAIGESLELTCSNGRLTEVKDISLEQARCTFDNNNNDDTSQLKVYGPLDFNNSTNIKLRVLACPNNSLFEKEETTIMHGVQSESSNYFNYVNNHKLNITLSNDLEIDSLIKLEDINCQQDILLEGTQCQYKIIQNVNSSLSIDLEYDNKSISLSVNNSFNPNIMCEFNSSSKRLELRNYHTDGCIITVDSIYNSSFEDGIIKPIFLAEIEHDVLNDIQNTLPFVKYIYIQEKDIPGVQVSQIEGGNKSLLFSLTGDGIITHNSISS